MNKFQAKHNKNQQVWTPRELPITEVLALYARQSTKNQVIKFIQSGEMQTDDLVAFAKRLGWREDLIILFIENRREDGTIKNASGRLRIDQREGLQALVEQIEKGVIKAVLVFLEDRLFRDETQIQVNVFIEICKKHDVIIITPHMTYDFSNPFHVKQFRWRCEEAADFLRDYIQIRMGGAARRVAEKGFYDGRNIPLGFIIDRCKTIIVEGQGVPNPTYKRYIVYEPHARVVRRILDRYVYHGGNLKRLYRELCQEAVLFPAFPENMPKDVIGNRNLKEVPGGYHLSESGLREMLMNVAYIGWWRYCGSVRKENHTAIVQEEKFWFAFNRLSPYMPDGTENTQRPNKRGYGKRNSPALLKECIDAADPCQVAYASEKFGAWYYEITYRKPHVLVGRIVTVQVAHLDEMFKDKLMEHLQQTDSYQHYAHWLEKRTKERARAGVSINNQLRAIKRDCLGIRKSLRKPNLHEGVRVALEGDLAELLTQEQELENKKIKLNGQQEGTTVVKLSEYKILMEKLAPYWDKLTLEKRKALVHALVKHVTLGSLSPHFLHFTIEWDNPLWGIDECLIWRTQGTAPEWSEEEQDIMRLHWATTKRDAVDAASASTQLDEYANYGARLTPQANGEIKSKRHTIYAVSFRLAAYSRKGNCA